MNNILYQEVSLFSKLINDYLNQKESLKKLYHLYPSLENFEQQITQKSENFKNREALVQILLSQNKDCANITLNQIESLNQSTTFTVTTGHQLNLFTGPLYVFYKIITVINTCKALKSKYSNYNFVPIFWMATEDHDFEEINHFYYNEQKIIWHKATSGPVGRISTIDFQHKLQEFLKYFPDNETGKTLKILFEEAYLKKENLAEATRFLINHFFEADGLVIIDGDDKGLKKLMTPIIKDEIINQNSFHHITETNKDLKDYHIQINPREINWFYIKDNLRERIIFQKDKFYINNTNIHFSQVDIEKEIDHFPERFSPNALLRPLYQEVVLPNLTYVGGAAEVAYWLQLKSTFNHYKIVFPMVMLRDHVILINEKQKIKIEKYNVKLDNLFLSDVELSKLLTKQYSSSNVDFRRLREDLKNQFVFLNQIISQTDKSFEGAVLAEQSRQLKSLDKLEKRFWKAEQKRLQEKIDNVLNLKKELFPKGIMQERVLNFSTFYVEMGEYFIYKLKNDIHFDLENLKVIQI